MVPDVVEMQSEAGAALGGVGLTTNSRIGLCGAEADGHGLAQRGTREAARDWSLWKAQERYRATPTGKQKRNGQSRRYRERVRNWKQREKEAVPEAARVITTEDFFRWLLRPTGLLRPIRVPAAKPAATVLLTPVPACDGARLGAGAALAEDARRLSRLRISGEVEALAARAISAARSSRHIDPPPVWAATLQREA